MSFDLYLLYLRYAKALFFLLKFLKIFGYCSFICSCKALLHLGGASATGEQGSADILRIRFQVNVRRTSAYYELISVGITAAENTANAAAFFGCAVEQLAHIQRVKVIKEKAKIFLVLFDRIDREINDLLIELSDLRAFCIDLAQKMSEAVLNLVLLYRHLRRHTCDRCITRAVILKRPASAEGVDARASLIFDGIKQLNNSYLPRVLYVRRTASAHINVANPDDANVLGQLQLGAVFKCGKLVGCGVICRNG